MIRPICRAAAVALCLATAPPFIGPAAAATPTAQDLLAEQDQALQRELVEWTRGVFALPPDLVLDDSLRRAATDIANAHIERTRASWPAWIAQQRAAAGQPDLRGKALSMPLYLRAINELALMWVERTGPAQDEAWLKAALAPTACEWLFPTWFARRIAMIQAAPPEARATLLAGERERLQRWGTKRKDLPARPAAADLAAADQAIAALRDAAKVTGQPMPPVLAGWVFDSSRKPGPPPVPDRWEQCARSQWWLASQLAEDHADRAAALDRYRYATLYDAREFVPDRLRKQPTAPPPPPPPGTSPTYPPEAGYFQAEGTTTVRTERDAQGRFLKAEVVKRRITVPGVRDNPPLAYETLFDAASLDYAARQAASAYAAHAATPANPSSTPSTPKEKPGDGKQSYLIELVWHLDGGDDAAH
jgi:hypothetical protein